MIFICLGVQHKKRTTHVEKLIGFVHKQDELESAEHTLYIIRDFHAGSFLCFIDPGRLYRMQKGQLKLAFVLNFCVVLLDLDEACICN